MDLLFDTNVVAMEVERLEARRHAVSDRDGVYYTIAIAIRFADVIVPSHGAVWCDHSSGSTTSGYNAEGCQSGSTRTTGKGESSGNVTDLAVTQSSCTQAPHID